MTIRKKRKIFGKSFLSYYEMLKDGIHRFRIAIAAVSSRERMKNRLLKNCR